MARGPVLGKVVTANGLVWRELGIRLDMSVPTTDADEGRFTGCLREEVLSGISVTMEQPPLRPINFVFQ